MLRWTGLGGKNSSSNAANASKEVAVGGNGGSLQAVGSDGLTEDERLALEEMDRFYGMENFGNTCYANSILQALYFCRPFRECVNTYPSLKSPYIPIRSKPSHLQLPSSPSLDLPAPPPIAPPIPSPSLQPTKTSRWPGSRNKTPATPPTLTAPAPEPTPSSSPTPGSSDPSTRVVNPSDDPTSSVPPATLFLALQTLFRHIASIPPPVYGLPPKDKDGFVGRPTPLTRTVVAPAAFVGKVKMENEMFRGTMQQDAHEFLNYLLNKVGEDLELEEKDQKVAEEKKKKEEGLSDSLSNSLASLDSTTSDPRTSAKPKRTGPEPTFVHKLFQGTLTNETRCLSCETTSSRDESFLDLSIDIEQNTSITACLRQFSASETLCQRNKFYCDNCCSLQEAEKRLKIKTLPNILALHLKRFKYQEDVGRYVKLSYRVVFPFQLRLFNTSDDTENPDRLYDLFAIVVHVGGGPHHGHYIAIVKTGSGWMQFDDETVSAVNEEDIQKYFGESSAGSGYVLFYQAVDLDAASLGLKRREPEQPRQQPPLPRPTSTMPPSSAGATAIPISPISEARPNGLFDVPETLLDDSLTPMPSPSRKIDPPLAFSTPFQPSPSPAPSSFVIPPSPTTTTSSASAMEPSLSSHSLVSNNSASTSPSNSRSIGLGSLLGRSPPPPSPLLPAPPPMQRNPSMSASSTFSSQQSVSNSPNLSTTTSSSAGRLPSLTLDTSASGTKEKEKHKEKEKEGGGGWFSRRSGKEKMERRVSSSSSWYGSLSGHTASASSTAPSSPTQATSMAASGRERHWTGPPPSLSPIAQREADDSAYRNRLPSAPGLLESRSPAASAATSPISENGLGLRSLPPPSPSLAGSFHSSTSANGAGFPRYDTSSSIPSLNPATGLPSSPSFSSSATTTTTSTSTSASTNPSLALPPSTSYASAPTSPLASTYIPPPPPSPTATTTFTAPAPPLPPLDPKLAKKEREKAEKDFLKRQKMERKISTGPGSISKLGGLGSLGRSSSMMGLKMPSFGRKLTEREKDGG